MDGRISELTNRIVLVKAEKTLYLIHCRILLNFNCVRIEMLDIMGVQKDEGPVKIKAEGNDILDVAETHVYNLIIAELWPV